jgi:hypothetical protein
VYRELLVPQPARPKTLRFLKGGVAGLAALGVARWLWRQSKQQKHTASGD